MTSLDAILFTTFVSQGHPQHFFRDHLFKLTAEASAAPDTAGFPEMCSEVAKTFQKTQQICPHLPDLGFLNADNAVIPKILGDSWVSAEKSLLGGAARSFFESLGATKVHKIGALPSLHCAKMACTGASKKISTVSRSGGRSQPAWRKYAKKMALLH